MGRRCVPKIIVLRFTRVVFGVTASPFLLNATVNYHVNQYLQEDPAFVEKIKPSMYVDDIIFGASGEEEAYQLYTASKQRLREGGFTLRKFISNSTKLIVKIQSEDPVSQLQLKPVEPEDASYAQSLLHTELDTTAQGQKVLGVLWNYITDSLIFDLTKVASMASTMEPTERNIVSLTAKFYDPLGLMSPVTIKMKVFFQALCKKGVDWDQ